MGTETELNTDGLRELIADVLDIEPDAITDEVHFVRDLGVDSLLALELAVTLERQYGIKVESHEVADVQTLRDISELLARKIQARA